ncbi:TolC family protein [uncultured Sunxiuqinia sp.]|uniref:TolC family protein n=1 Tax=uncultured Sunxiuqinia sp. TaxID=1573825 RepID=UPI00262F8F41|nr:TolC family protein [uncultured Sunxiuqinia sp.]
MKQLKVFFLLILASLSLKAQPSLSLEEAIKRSLENNYDITLVKQQQQIASINNSWGAAGRYPYIGVSLGADYALNDNANEDFIQNRFSGGVNLNWTLFDGFAVKITKQRFAELEELSKQNTAIMVEGTIQSVVLAYYAALLEKERLNVLNEVMLLSEDRYQRIQQRKELGSAVTFEVLQAQNAYLTDKTSYLSQQVFYKNALRDLAFLMADDSGASYELNDEFQAMPVSYVLADLQAQMVANNKSLKNQYINQNLLENAILSAKSSYYPTLSFAGGATHTRTGNDFENSGISWNNVNNMYGNFTLSYNLFSGGNRKRALQIARLEEENGLVELEQMKHELDNKLANLYEFYLVRQELLSVARENMEAAKLNFQIAREKFESGAINSFNFRDVQLIYLNTSLQELQAIYNFIDTHTALLRMVGTIVQQYE